MKKTIITNTFLVFVLFLMGCTVSETDSTSSDPASPPPIEYTNSATVDITNNHSFSITITEIGNSSNPLDRITDIKPLPGDISLPINDTTSITVWWNQKSGGGGNSVYEIKINYDKDAQNSYSYGVNVEDNGSYTVTLTDP